MAQSIFARLFGLMLLGEREPKQSSRACGAQTSLDATSFCNGQAALAGTAEVFRRTNGRIAIF